MIEGNGGGGGREGGLIEGKVKVVFKRGEGVGLIELLQPRYICMIFSVKQVHSGALKVALFWTNLTYLPLTRVMYAHCIGAAVLVYSNYCDNKIKSLTFIPKLIFSQSVIILFKQNS